MNFWNVLLWMGAIYLGFNFLVFLIKIAVVYFWIVKDERGEDDQNEKEHDQ